MGVLPSENASNTRKICRAQGYGSLKSLLLRTSGADGKLRDKNHLRFPMGTFCLYRETIFIEQSAPLVCLYPHGEKGGVDFGEWGGGKSPAWGQGLTVGPSGPMLDLAECSRYLKSAEEFVSHCLRAAL